MEKKNKLHSVSQGEEQILNEKMLDDLGIEKEQIGYAFDSSGHVYTTRTVSYTHLTLPTIQPV